MSSTTDTDGRVLEACEGFARNYLQDEAARLNKPGAADPPVVTVSWRDLNRYDPNLADDYFTAPEVVERHLQLAFANTATLTNASLTEQDLREATIRVTDLPDHKVVDVGSYTPSEVVEQVRGLRGQISRVTAPELLGNSVAFECQRCGAINDIPQTVEHQQEPQECVGCERQGPFTINAAETEFIDYQRVRLETPPEDRGREGAEHLDLTLRGDLVRAVRPGERVTLNSAVSIEQSDDDRPTFAVTGEVNSVEHAEEDLDAVNIDEHREAIEALRERDDISQAVVDSIAPSIYGHEDVKEAVALQLFGGVHRELADGSDRRGTINCLLMGDPGTGKSVILSYVADLAPRSVYTSGNNATAAGLTAACVQDDFGGGGWTIKAGALVQAHRGVCCIDELDDMHEADMAGMLEALSQQQVSKAAAGENVTLPARTTVLAGANPMHGRWDPRQPVADQIDLDPALLSRFDLMFVFRDEQDPDRDRELSKQMLAPARGDEQDSASPEIDRDVLRAYIAYARQQCDPQLSPEADQHLRQRYIEIRQANDEDGPVPTTPRLLDAMRRLAEASARMRLSETVSEADAERAADLAVSCLQDVGVDPETGAMDVDVVESGTSKAQRDRITAMEGICTELQDEGAVGGVPIDDFLERCGQAGLDTEKVEHELETLKRQGKVYEPADGQIRFT